MPCHAKVLCAVIVVSPEVVKPHVLVPITARQQLIYEPPIRYCGPNGAAAAAA